MAIGNIWETEKKIISKNYFQSFFNDHSFVLEGKVR